MGDAQSSDIGNNDSENPIVTFVTSAAVTLRRSFLAFVITVGVVMLILSVLVSDILFPGLDYGLISAMMLIWGISALIYAVLGNIGLRVIGYR